MSPWVVLLVPAIFALACMAAALVLWWWWRD